MKKYLFTLVLLLSSVVGNAQTFKLGDVNKDGDVNISDVMMVVDIVMNGYKPLTLSSENVEIDNGSSATVNISSGYGPYDITCSDGNHVGVLLNGTLLSITGKAVGTAVVTVTDTATGYTKDINVTVKENQPASLCPDDHHPHMIDLGLPSGTKWACCNVDTDHPENQSPTNYGGYYAWGETETKSDYSQSTYQYYKNGSYQSIGSDIAGTEYDVAHVKWGGSWVMPSRAQQNELLNNCTSTWTTQNGVSGRLFTGINGGSIFLPAAGVRFESDLKNVGSFSDYWSSTQDPSYSNCAYRLYFYSGLSTTYEDARFIGFSVRPVVSVSPVVNLELSIAVLNLTEGVVDYEEITSGSGYYTVESSNESVVTATLQGNFIMINVVSVGTATITVTDTKSGQTATIEVTVENKPPQSFLACPDDHHPHLIDLGLPSGTKWACCNVDTDYPEDQSPENYGGYYAWGETETKSTYDWGTYIHCDDSYDTCHDLGDDIAGTEYDVAHVKWGGSWVMPSKEQQDELCIYCTCDRVAVNGVNGRKFTGTNGDCIFLPDAGCRYDSGFDNVGSEGYYLSSTQYPSYADYAYLLNINSGFADTDYGNRYAGFSVRPVVSVSPVVNLELSVAVLNLTEGVVDYEEITSGSGYYTVESSNENVVTATLQGNSIMITAVSAGTATITVTDTKSGQTATIEVTVENKPPQSFLACPDDHHPHLIDLGLPSGTKWACCNVDDDASKQSPTNYGSYYAWGETKEHDDLIYDWSTYTHCDGSSSTCHGLGSDIAGTQYDVAHVKWGGSWMMPSRGQQDELIDNCTYEWTTVNGVNGGRFTSKTNGGSIFLPAAGVRDGSVLIGAGSGGGFWSSTQEPSYSSGAYTLDFNSGSTGTEYIYDRDYGFTVRPVSRN